MADTATTADLEAEETLAVTSAEKECERLESVEVAAGVFEDADEEGARVWPALKPGARVMPLAAAHVAGSSSYR